MFYSRIGRTPKVVSSPLTAKGICYEIRWVSANLLDVAKLYRCLSFLLTIIWRSYQVVITFWISGVCEPTTLLGLYLISFSYLPSSVSFRFVPTAAKRFELMPAIVVAR